MNKIKLITVLIALVSVAWSATAVKITSTSQLISGTHATGVIGDYLISNDSASFIISDIPNTLSPGKSGGLCIDAALNGGVDDFDLMYLYLDNDWPRQAVYNSIQIISDDASHDSAHIRVSGVDFDNSEIAIITDYILYNDTPMLKVVTEFNNQSSSALSSFGLGDAFSWGSDPFVPGGNSSTGWLASKTPNTLYGYMAMKDFAAIHGGYWSDATLEEANIPAGSSESITRYFVVAEDLTGVYDLYLTMRNFPTGTALVSVSKDGSPVNNATVSFIKEMENEATVYDHTDNTGSLNILISSGNWICRVTSDSQVQEQTFTITENAQENLEFILGETSTPSLTQDTLTIIQSPIINIPTMALPGDTIEVKIDLIESEFIQSLSILNNGNDYELDFTELGISSPFGLRTIEAYLPSSILYGLYDLKLTASGHDTLDISENALYVIPEYQDTFTFIHVTDTHLPSKFYWGDDGLEADSSEIVDFREVINDINIIDPDFVLLTGDFINDGEIEALGVPSLSRGKKLLHELNVPVFLVPGNHDLGGWDSTPAPDGTARRTWWNYFGWKYLSSTSPTATTTQNYSFNYGDAHFVGLEAYDNYDEWRYDLYGETSFISSQLQWLSDDLTQHANDELKILFYHMDFKRELDLSALGVDAAFWGHVHGNNEDSTHPYSISTAATCNGNRWYRIVKIIDNEIVFTKAVWAGNTGEILTKVVNHDGSLVRISNGHDFDLEDCMVTFPLQDGLEITGLTNASLYQVDSLSNPKLVYALVDVPANSSVDASMQTDSILTNIETGLPESHFLMNIYPNPFNPDLTISYKLSFASNLDISIYDIQGRQIDTVYTGQQNSGNYKLYWDASDQPSGLYFVKAEIKNASGNFQSVEKCLLMK